MTSTPQSERQDQVERIAAELSIWHRLPPGDEIALAEKLYSAGLRLVGGEAPNVGKPARDGH